MEKHMGKHATCFERKMMTDAIAIAWDCCGPLPSRASTVFNSWAIFKVLSSYILEFFKGIKTLMAMALKTIG